MRDCTLASFPDHLPSEEERCSPAPSPEEQPCSPAPSPEEQRCSPAPSPEEQHCSLAPSLWRAALFPGPFLHKQPGNKAITKPVYTRLLTLVRIRIELK